MNSDINIADELQKMMADYAEEVMEATERVGEKVSQKAAQSLQAKSPKDRPKYANGWTSRKTEQGTYEVYNSTHPGLTHILEKGHVVANQYGATGKRVKARKHIRPVEQESVKEYYEKIVEEVNGTK